MQTKTKTYEVKISETAYYTLTVMASSASEAKNLVRDINKGHASISDFQPDQNGGSCPSRYGNVVVKSVQEIV